MVCRKDSGQLAIPQFLFTYSWNPFKDVWENNMQLVYINFVFSINRLKVCKKFKKISEMFTVAWQFSMMLKAGFQEAYD